MCGIAGVLFKGTHDRVTTGRALVEMLDGCQHRGPDSIGFALYREARPEHLRLRFLVGSGAAAAAAVAAIKRAFGSHGATLVEEEAVGSSHRFLVRFTGELQAFAYAMETVAKLLSLGCKAAVLGVAAAIALGGTIEGETLAFYSELSPTERAESLPNPLKASAGEASIMARCTGKTDVHNLEPEDLRAITLATAVASGVPLAGTQEVPPAAD